MNKLNNKRGQIMRLTNREAQVMSLLCSGLKDRAIANTLGLSVRTVQNYLAKIYIKYRAKNRTQAVSKFLNIHGKLVLDLVSGEKNEKDNSSLDWREIYSLVNGF